MCTVQPRGADLGGDHRDELVLDDPLEHLGPGHQDADLCFSQRQHTEQRFAAEYLQGLLQAFVREEERDGAGSGESAALLDDRAVMS